MLRLSAGETWHQIAAGYAQAIEVQFTDGEDAIDPGTVSVTVARADGSALVLANPVTGTGTAPRAVILTAAETLLPDRLTFTWTATAPDVAPVVASVEIVSELLFSLTEARGTGRNALADLTDATLAYWRATIDQAFARVAGVAFGTHYGIAVADEVGYGGDLLLYHDPSDPALGGEPVLRLTKVRSVETRTSVGGAWTAYSPTDLAALEVHSGGMLVSPLTWPSGRWRVRIGFEHGYPRVPLDIRRAALALLRHWAKPGDLPARAISQNTEMGNFTLATAGMRGSEFGVPDVDSVLGRFAQKVPVIR